MMPSAISSKSLGKREVVFWRCVEFTHFCVEFTHEGLVGRIGQVGPIGGAGAEVKSLVKYPR